MKERGPGDWPLSVIWLLTILQLVAHSTLLYYLSIKMRALYARVSAAHRAAGTLQLSSAAGPGSSSRWLIGFGRRFDSALEMEEWFMDSKKGAGILFGLSTVWIAAVGLATVYMLAFVVFLGNGGIIGALGIVVGGVSLLGYLGYLWVTSVKILVLEAWRRGRGGRRPGRDVEEGDEEDGERLLPLGTAAQGRRFLLEKSWC
ncbi:hypothetical protein V8F33_013909 [Rhypophila sp. PSN 637]